MNREIKFSVWDGFRFDNSYDVIFYQQEWHAAKSDCGGDYHHTYCYEDGFRIQQYTGLKDKNGTEIYEGDIIIHDDSNIGGFKGVYEVIWNDDYTLDSPAFGLWSNKGYRRFDLGILEVIGNIYENKELLNDNRS